MENEKELLLKTYRGKIEDLYTFGSIVVVDKEGNIVFSKGNPNEISFPRSSAKLMQAMVPLSLGAKEKFNLTSKEIAQILAVSESRVSQLHTRALLRLRGDLLSYQEELELSERSSTRTKRAAGQVK